MLTVLEFLGFLFGFYLLISQIVIPIVMGTKCFPGWRRKALVSELTDVRESIETAKLRNEVEAAKKMADSLKEQSKNA